MTPARAFLDRLIDYAGLFPPAAFEMPAAVAQYASQRRGPHAWMLGRFIVPLARLNEMCQAAGPNAADWPLSLLALPGDRLPFAIDSVEMKIDRADDIRRFSGPAPPLRYFEIPIAADPRDLLMALAETGGRAKVRTGGVTGACPTADDLARFLCGAAAMHVPFKATAGLHHPIACPPAHGFVNLFLAAALAYHGGAPEEVAATLEETAAQAFLWDSGAVAWHRHCLSFEQILTARAEFAISFGSCSFEEPISGLQALGWL